MDQNKRAFILGDLETWADASIKDAMREMQALGAGTVSMTISGQGGQPVFALVMITGEHTQEVLNAIDAVTGDESIAEEAQ